MADREAARSEPQASGAPPDGDARLLEALRRGDEDAFRELVREHAPFLMRLVMMHVPSRAIAEEVVGDTWEAVLKGLDRFEGRSSLRTWIASIALNKARTRGTREGRIVPFALLRRRYEEGGGPAVDHDRFQGRRGERPGWWASPPAAWEEPERQLEAAETRDVMLRAIRDLPPRQREVIALRDLAGWDAAEVCNALDLTETNQRVLLHRARSKVRAALEEHLEPNEEQPSR
ncbi:MAG TPA: sigma-70 family RNA polymerase sigma factor [Solirubrobacterales bacterium]|nr:sigma-70 family RNA polymerase sigma factor [Solirubrobacterales bacterium]